MIVDNLIEVPADSRYSKNSRKISLRKLFVSPYGATVFPIFVLVVAFLFPPKLYQYYMNEPDYTFLNFPLVLYVSACLIFYYMGIFISNFKLSYRLNFLKGIKRIGLNYLTYVKIIALAVIFLEILFIVVFNLYFTKTAHVNILAVCLSGAGDLIKAYSHELNIPFGLGGIPAFVIGFEFWLLYHMYYLENKYKYLRKFKYLKFLILLSALLFIIESTVTVGRSGLITFILGWMMIYIYFHRANLFGELIKLFLITVIIFAVTSILRWGSSGENFLYLIFSRFIGYTIADYNRAALMISGKLSYVNYGIPKIFYVFPVLKIPLTNIVFFDLRDTSPLSLLAVGDAGLNPSYNMTTLFGGIYQAIGLGSFVYFAILGIIGNKLFMSFKKKRTFGMIFYPLFYASVALWIGDVNIFIKNFLYYFYAFIVIVAYNILFKPKEFNYE